MWWVRLCLGLGSAPYQPLYPFLLCLLQGDDINLCQGSWVQTNELCRNLEVSQREGQEWVRRVTPKRDCSQAVAESNSFQDPQYESLPQPQSPHPHLLQQGLHLPLLPLLPAPVRITLQAVEVGLSSPWREGRAWSHKQESSSALQPDQTPCSRLSQAHPVAHLPGTSMLVMPPLCPTPSTSSKGQN